MRFTIWVYLFWGLFILVESLGVWALIHPRYKTVRYFLMFCIERDVVVLLSSFISPRYYFYTFWTFQMVELCWVAQITGWACKLTVPSLPRWVQYLPFAVVVGLTLYNFPPIHTASHMNCYMAHCLMICFTCTGFAAAYRENEVYIEQLLTISGLIFANLFPLLTWYHPLYWEVMWTLGVCGLITLSRQVPPLSDILPVELGGRPARGW